EVEGVLAAGSLPGRVPRIGDMTCGMPGATLKASRLPCISQGLSSWPGGPLTASGRPFRHWPPAGRRRIAVRQITKAALTLAATVSTVAALAALALGAGLATAAPAPAAAAATTTYTVTNLGSLGYGETDGVAINANGQVTGHSWNGASITLASCCGGCYRGGPPIHCKELIYHPFVWSHGTIADLGTLGRNFRN